MKRSLLDDVIRALGEPSPGALSAAQIAKLRLGEAPLPRAAREVLALRPPAWDMPGMWKRAAPSSLQGLSLSALVKLVFPGIRANDFWDVAALETMLPGRCHPLGLDAPVSFLYVGKPDDEGDCPVLTHPSYIGGLAADARWGRALAAALRRCEVSFEKRNGQLLLEAPRR